MGIYIFNRDSLIRALDNTHADFGKHVIPEMIHQVPVHGLYLPGVLGGHRHDPLLLRCQSESHRAVPPFNFFDTKNPIYTHARFLPASKVNGATVNQAIISDGCVINDAQIDRAVIGVRSYIGAGTTIRNSIIMGADFYEVDMAQRAKGPGVGIGTQLRRSTTRSSTRTPASATASSSPRTASRRTTTRKTTISATES